MEQKFIFSIPDVPQTLEAQSRLLVPPSWGYALQISSDKNNTFRFRRSVLTSIPLNQQYRTCVSIIKVILYKCGLETAHFYSKVEKIITCECNFKDESDELDYAAVVQLLILLEYAAVVNSLVQMSGLAFVSVVIDPSPLLTFINQNSYSSEAKWTYRRSSFGVVYLTSKWVYQLLHQVAEYVRRLGIVLSMNVQQGIGFKNSGRGICPSVIKLKQDDHRPWMTKPCRRPLGRTVVKCVVHLPDNSTLPVARNTIQPLSWETLCHPTYSSILAPSDYHLFHSLDNHLRGKSFTNEADRHQALTDFFASHAEFYRKSIEQLETRWQKDLNRGPDLVLLISRDLQQYNLYCSLKRKRCI
ncbi:histone-lysine N-methyltransferase SETMAR [Trichonephila inaurata madagascariensis]|uniref:Histone-lysine N-methyltransferase SETMAR n=1 Tax=Trichonephila inaurata madagascariensis TaxID=2747483 RepID=A0A8X6WZC3_9ARAC|nr:histone-lysine N-methyltransferase SETMAR [Trichonephila inaurata madagascariensis]